MSWPVFEFDLRWDLFPMLAGMLAAIGCGVLGNFLVLRRLSLMGDAISHSVLPGLVIAFLVASTRSPMVMLLGAAIAGACTVVLVELVKKHARIEPGAAMGVVFSVLFALGVLLIEKADARHIDLDADCVLHGQLETLVWYDAPRSMAELFSAASLADVPTQIYTLGIMVALALGLVTVLFKELRIAAFDPALATSQGFSASALHYVLMLFVAAATVASFEAVGSILVIAMLVCPAATARLVTDRLATQIVWSVVFAVGASVGGYVLAAAVPSAFGLDAVSASGSMAVCAGVLLATAIIASPRHGVLARTLRRRRLARTVSLDDVLAAMFRASEAGGDPVTVSGLSVVLPGRRVEAAIASATRSGLIERDGDAVRLTAAGRDEAAGVVRRHRLWEAYLVDEAGFAVDHVHDVAERLEHLDTAPPRGPASDPHGRDIPS